MREKNDENTSIEEEIDRFNFNDQHNDEDSERDFVIHCQMSSFETTFSEYKLINERK